MFEHMLEKLFEHNNWANGQIIEACSALSDEQLDVAPQSSTIGTIRETLVHLVSSQHGYLRLLTLPVEARVDVTPAFDELKQSTSASGEGLLALAREEQSEHLTSRLETTDGYYVERWVVLVQIINHATEHREQLCSMLSSLGVIPPVMDAWAYGEVTNTLIPISTDHG